MGIVFYYSPMSSSTRVQWALEELGVPYDRVRVDLSAGEQRKPEFLAVNPNGKVPAMVVDGRPLFESLAMLLYLGEVYGVDKGLFPPAGAARLEAFKWMAWSSVSLTEPIVRLFRNTADRFPAEQRNAAAAEAARAEVGGLVQILEQHLGSRPFLLGDAFSLADCAVTAVVLFAARLGIALPPAVAAWSGRCTARPAFARALQG